MISELKHSFVRAFAFRVWEDGFFLIIFAWYIVAINPTHRLYGSLDCYVLSTIVTT